MSQDCRWTLTPGTAISLKGLADYALGSIVSKTLMDRNNGTLTLFAFDAGQSLSEHTAPFDALVQVIEGEVELTIGGKNITAKAGDLTLMPANTPHAVKAKAPMKMLLTMIRQ